MAGILLTDSEGGAIPLIFRSFGRKQFQESGILVELSKAASRAIMPTCQEVLFRTVWQQVAAAAGGLADCTVHGDGEHGNDESRISHGSFLAGIPRSLAHQLEHIGPRALILCVL